MKRWTLFAIGLALMAGKATAQHPERAQVIIHYKFTHVRDTGNRAHPFTENMALYAGRSASVYRSYEDVLEDVRYKKEFDEQMAKSPNGYVTVNHNYTGSPTEYFLFPNEQKFLIKDQLLSNSYLVEEPVAAISWKISGDMATFGGLHCQKATGHFRGRDYTVWFCPDLPVQTGPWKLNGLPGVIVDAHDAKNEVVFKFDGVEKVVQAPQKNIVGPNGKKPLPMLGMVNANPDPELIELPANAIKTTQKQFDKLSAAMHKDPNAFASAMAGGNMKGDGPKMDVKNGGKASTVINNPIELPEKK